MILPPFTWRDVVTKADVDASCDRLGNLLRAEFSEGMNRQIKWPVAFAAVWTTVLVTLVP